MFEKPGFFSGRALFKHFYALNPWVVGWQVDFQSKN
jgi:hypothetical protein